MLSPAVSTASLGMGAFPNPFGASAAGLTGMQPFGPTAGGPSAAATYAAAFQQQANSLQAAGVGERFRLSPFLSSLLSSAVPPCPCPWSVNYIPIQIPFSFSLQASQERR